MTPYPENQVRTLVRDYCHTLTGSTDYGDDTPLTQIVFFDSILAVEFVTGLTRQFPMITFTPTLISQLAVISVESLTSLVMRAQDAATAGSPQ